jgi:hypothetical protein
MTAGSARTSLALIAAALLSGPSGAPLRAQRNQPVYPAYDGFIVNADGSHTIAFAYFSHNAEVVTIPPGPDNQFSPVPIDRQQPTTFHPGHNRFQCVMVVGPGFDGKLTWNLTYAGTTTGTSQHMLQSNWNLVEGAEQLKTIDFARAPKGVCLNQPPNVRVLGAPRGRGGTLPAITATVGEALNLFGSVSDEGLPRGGALTIAWKQVSGPAPVTFEDAAAARTRARFTAPGTYELELSASDAELAKNVHINVVVGGPAKH